MRTVHTIDYSEAKRVVDLIVEKALQMQKAVVIAVADAARRPHLLCAHGWRSCLFHWRRHE
jgi:hypothetical protein